MKLLLLAALVGCACARTATRQPGVQAHITSLTDKDARAKAMAHPAFANAGRQAGVELWRIENFEPVPVPAKDHGKFYKGDSYIILKTSADKKNNLSWDIHYWLGSQTSQDEAGAAAILTVGLDDKFGGAAIQHRETEGHESQQFLGYFQSTIRYLDGGHASGFTHVSTNAGASKRLFQIKGKKNIRVRQVDPLISSMNKGDCFILDLDQDIFVYVGEKTRNVEKLKAISVANQIRDQDHNGRGKVDIVDQYSSQADVERFFTALGSGSRDSVPEDSAGGDDQAFERNEEQTVTLSEISDSSGKLKITPLKKPYTQEQLKPQECYILDTVSGSIYVWVGKQSTDREKTEAMAKAEQYLTAKKYPAWVHVSRVPQGTEPAAFKQYFTTWRDVGMRHSRIVRSLSDEEYYNSDDEVSARRAQIVGRTGAARAFMPDEGTGKYTVYGIEPTTNKLEADASNQGKLYQGDAYVIKYTYDKDGAKNYVIYYWVGKDASKQDESAAATSAEILHSRITDAPAVLVKVPQGEEPKHFLKMFKGELVTLFGKQSEETADSIRLFQIHGNEYGVDTRAQEVPVTADSFRADDVFLLKAPGQRSGVWIGKESNASERSMIESFAEAIIGRGAEYERIHQGSEPAHFKDHLGGEDIEPSTTQAWRDRLARRLGATPSLYEVAVDSRNVFTFDEQPNYQQVFLQPDEVNLLDTGDEVYVWIGDEAEPRLAKNSLRIIESYFKKAGHARVAIVIKQGAEPEAFTRLFDSWDPDMWIKQNNYEQEKEKMLRENFIDTD
ncbi:hypothetical protein JYU34_008091 [Plutella xylostella]|uniref:Gelsolin-like domain-containing protein n=1 Tax=Plutella xylostella TaxID=51655 RepID=A0ABQ7QNP5_PLUXY|nr:hypothetical protein JYU34_008091 [Plutella xylostella]